MGGSGRIELPSVDRESTVLAIERRPHVTNFGAATGIPTQIHRLEGERPVHLDDSRKLVGAGMIEIPTSRLKGEFSAT